MEDELDYSSLPPRREKHRSKNDNNDEIPQISDKVTTEERVGSIKKMNSRFARRKAIKEYTLNPQGYKFKAEKEKKKTEPETKHKKKKKWSGGLITANIILWLFLLMVGGIFFYIVYYY